MWIIAMSAIYLALGWKFHFCHYFDGLWEELGETRKWKSRK